MPKQTRIEEVKKTRRAFLKLPIEERRKILAEQASDPEIQAYYCQLFPQPLQREQAQAMEQLILFAMTNDGEYQVEDAGEHATEIASALIFNGYGKLPQPLDDKELREKWKDTVIKKLPEVPMSLERVRRDRLAQAEITWNKALALLQQRVEADKEQEIPREVIEAIEDAKILGAKWERERILEIIKDWQKWASEEGGELKWAAKYGGDTTEVLTVVEQALKGGE